MKAEALAGLAVARAESDADLEAMAAVRGAVDSDVPPPRIDNLRHYLDSNPNLTFFVARHGARPVGCGFVEIVDAPYAQASADVVPDARRRGVGTALLREISAVAAAAGKDELQGETRQSNAEARAFFERRGYRVVGGEQAVVLSLDDHDPAAIAPPPGIEIVTRAERPDVVEGMYEVSREADEDIPGNDEVRTFSAFRAQDVERPTRRADLCFVALAGDEVVGYALLDDGGTEAFHGLTAVKRSWRRRGVASALKRAQIARAKDLGYRRLITESEERNAPMRELNLKLGYRPEPAFSTVVLRGPLLE